MLTIPANGHVKTFDESISGVYIGVHQQIPLQTQAEHGDSMRWWRHVRYRDQHSNRDVTTVQRCTPRFEELPEPGVKRACLGRPSQSILEITEQDESSTATVQHDLSSTRCLDVDAIDCKSTNYHTSEPSRLTSSSPAHGTRRQSRTEQTACQQTRQSAYRPTPDRGLPGPSCPRRPTTMFINYTQDDARKLSAGVSPSGSRRCRSRRRREALAKERYISARAIDAVKKAGCAAEAVQQLQALCGAFHNGRA
ncbi:hypothetical protein AMS68_002023 [Peltaster fructicola]|uniref:Uncharacterized protein n=1 Tax=Peltaster fructicola TaxID=286661 RepID=A0A6H0XP97_9PEZI|nr:hypothetical protein AMS68_002023 [Peltaster fructicola]